MPQPLKNPAKMTTEEAIRELFPGPVIDKAKQVVAESDGRPMQSTESDDSRN